MSAHNTTVSSTPLPAGAALSVERTGNLWESNESVYQDSYRYVLTRHWLTGHATDRAVFILLNPSTATAVADDPTVRRCIRFARREGCGGLVILNLFALRSTNPHALSTHPDPVGPHNDWFLATYTRTTGPVIAGWGTHGTLHHRAETVTHQLHAAGVPLKCLGTTTAGQPRHPLYLPNTAPLHTYQPQAQIAAGPPSAPKPTTNPREGDEIHAQAQH